VAYIELNNISFTYPDASQPAIRNLSLQIEKGQFVVLFGSSGSGKSTLLRLLKKEIQPHGHLSGTIHVNGRPLQEKNEIGFVFQDPENQVVADDVLHEIVFGLENLGLSTNEMRSRVAEMVHFFGVESLLLRKTHELSGGKKQQINLASVLLMQPDILLLDEPTAQLDPVSSRELLDMLIRLNDEFGMTIILAEHRLEEVFTVADKIIMMEKGTILIEGDPRDALEKVWNSPNKAYVPSIPSLFFQKNGRGSVPLTVKEGKKWIRNGINLEKEKKTQVSFEEECMKAKNIFFRYEKKSDFILNKLDFSLHKGEFYALLGGNGSGKSTLLKIVGGMLKPEHGKIHFEKKNSKRDQTIGYLPQNPKLFFIQDTVGKEIQDTIEKWGGEAEHLLEELGITRLVNCHPYDLSGGELQKTALACLLLRKPEILLLDEPTKGLDPISKENLAKILNRLNADGVTILMSTHDIEFAAQYASKCGMMFQGKITSEDHPENFFKGNFFYTTMTQRLFRHVDMVEEAVQPCES
jgi:energy-coupling factor transport system ATP-binding protein